MPENHVDATSLLFEMRNELEDLKKRNTEEIERMKHENLELRRKLAEKGPERTVEREGTSTSVRIPLSRHSTNNSTHTDLRPSIKRHPFTDEVVKAPLLANWRNPNFETYDDTTDPNEHLDTFATQVSLFTSDDEVLCRVFPTSLKELALSWFTKLPPYSVDSSTPSRPCLDPSLPPAGLTS